MEGVGRGVILFYSGYRGRTSLIILLPQVIGRQGVRLRHCLRKATNRAG